MDIEIKPYIEQAIPDVIRFERRLREEEDCWGWEIDDDYVDRVRRSFADAAFDDAISLLAYAGQDVIGRIDCGMIKTRFDGATQAYLDWICVLKSYRHRGVGQALLAALRARLQALGVTSLIAITAANDEAQRFYRAVSGATMRDVGIWIDV